MFLKDNIYLKYTSFVTLCMLHFQILIKFIFFIFLFFIIELKILNQ